MAETYENALLGAYEGFGHGGLGPNYGGWRLGDNGIDYVWFAPGNLPMDYQSVVDRISNHHTNLVLPHVDKNTPAWEASSNTWWPKRFTLTDFCCRLRKVGWTVTKTPRESARLSFTSKDYVAEEYDFPTIIFDLHWCIARMVIDRGPKISGTLFVAASVAQELENSATLLLNNPSITTTVPLTHFPDLVIQDVRDCQNWLLQFQNELTALKAKIVDAQSRPVNETLIHFVAGFNNEYPDGKDRPLDASKSWDSASSFEQFWGIHDWNQSFPNYAAGERSIDYSYWLWQLNVTASMLGAIDDQDFINMINHWTELSNEIKDLASTIQDISDTVVGSVDPFRTKEVQSLLQTLITACKTVAQTVSSFQTPWQKYLGYPGLPTLRTRFGPANSAVVPNFFHPDQGADVGPLENVWLEDPDTE